MKSAKEYYRSYQAGDDLSELNKMLVDEILKEQPNHVFEFGCGVGKNLRLIRKMQGAYARSNVHVSGLDISLVNVIHSIVKNGTEHIALGDENYLRHYCNYDVVITCSVLDHIPEIDGIIQELKRIANKSVIIAECIDDDPTNYYYPHDYFSYGFELIKESKFYSEADGHQYYIFKWTKQNEILPLAEFINGAQDDLAISK